MSKIAFLFAGQGSQYTGMGQSLYEVSPAARKVFQTIDEIRPGTSQQCFTAEKAQLSVTENTQPCLFATDLAAAEALRERGIVPAFAAGFSLGEIPALAFAGVLTVTEAFVFVQKRAEEMARCAETGKGVMFAVLGLSPEKVEELCALTPGCWPVNYNCKTQTVVSCREDAAQKLPDDVRKAGGKALKLAVSGGFHSPLMEEAARRLTGTVEKMRFDFSALPVYSNVTAKPYDHAGLLHRQVNSPVLWEKTVLALREAGADTFIEVGPGKTLSGLCGKILTDGRIFRVEDQKSLEETLSALNG